ncbi:MAG: hypothetical protein KAR40_17960 [Candidatus Sabulitectum sp.]|nr:hypothetical protein [Candidatus Sabulitectum sp.]
MTNNKPHYDANTPPVLLITFNRPDKAGKVLERIKEARPSLLCIACDGPRPGRDDDIARIKAIHDMVGRIDWCVNVKTLFRDTNLGCGPAVSQAITWFMEQAGEGIILEDDCLPDPTFFRFCGEMLDRYRNTTSVMQIAGYNLASGQYDPGYDYFFSQFGWQWGWATWKRAWDHFDLTMSSWPYFKGRGFHKYYPFSPERVAIWDRAYAGESTTWDYQWAFSMTTNRGLSVVPRYSMVENIGFGPDATHGTNDITGARYRVPVQPIRFPLTHERYVYPDHAYDTLLLLVHSKLYCKRNLFSRFQSRLRRLVGH